MSFDNQINLLQLASVNKRVKRLILHVHRNPSTGVWTMMKNLVREQNKSSGVMSVLGLPVDRDWRRSAYKDELMKPDLPYILTTVPKMFGTGAFIWSIASNPLRKWMEQIHHAFPEAELVLHSHSAWLTGGYLPLPMNNKTAIVATFHGIADDHRLRKLWWLRKAHTFLAQRLYHSHAVLTAVSNETAVRAENIFGIPDSAFTVIPNGMPCPDLSVPKVVSKCRAFLVGHVGQLHHGKGWRLLLEAVDRLRQDGRDIQLVLAGKGQDAELAREEALKRDGYVHFLGVVQNASECLIPQLDALVLATWSEGMPMSIIEAFAAGVPVLATPVGGIPEMLEDNVNGFLVERNPDSIAKKLCLLQGDPELVVRLKEGAMQTFKSKFEISRVVAQYEQLYDTALHRISN